MERSKNQKSATHEQNPQPYPQTDKSIPATKISEHDNLRYSTARGELYSCYLAQH